MTPRPAPFEERRSTYFAFQGLLMSVLLLLVLSGGSAIPDRLTRLFALALVLGASLIVVKLVAAATLRLWWFQAGIFVGDAALASITLHWTGARADLFLIYLLIVLGTALTRDVGQSLAVAAVTSALYLADSWHPTRGFPRDSVFWLRIMFLWVSSSLLAILSRDSHQTQDEADREARARQTETERLASLGQLSAEVAHRIKGPLTTILVNAEVLEHRLKLGAADSAQLRQIRDEAGRCKEILKNLLDLGRIEEMDPVAMDLRDSVRSALDSIRPQARQRGIELAVGGFEEPARVHGDPSLLHEAVAALLQNGIDALPRGGRLSLRLERGQPHSLEISDNGRGIHHEVLGKIFRPYFTTKSGEGSGLGLSAALRIIQKHGGEITARSEGPGQGAAFTLQLPALGEPPQARRRRPRPRP